MTDDETRWDRFLARHPRVENWVLRLRPRQLKWNFQSWRERRKWTPGTVFLEHGHIPAVIVAMDEYDGYDAISMVDGRTLAGSIFHCGPEPIDLKEAVKLANEMREKVDTQPGSTQDEPTEKGNLTHD